jgi:hypothetical protein
VTRDELIAKTRHLIDEGERIGASPSLPALQLWLQLSDDLLASAWGLMDRYHLAWLMVGKPKEVIRGRPMTPDEEAAYVREVAGQKTAALRMSLDAVERQGMPFRGEDGGVGAGQGMGSVPEPRGEEKLVVDGEAVDTAHLARGSGRTIPLDPGLAERLAEARRRAGEHVDHDTPRAPRPERLQR